MSPILTTSVLWLVLGQGPPRDEAAVASLRPEAGWKELGRNLWFDPKERQAIVRAQRRLPRGTPRAPHVRQGHQGSRVDPRDGRAAAAHPRGTADDRGRGGPSRPVRPEIRAALRVAHRHRTAWRQDGNLQKSDARQWVWDEKTKKPLAIEWVFAGSFVNVDPITKKTRYAADDGDLFTVANFGSSILDLPMASSADDADRVFTARTERIPPLGTEVFVVLSPSKQPRSAQPKKGAK